MGKGKYLRKEKVSVGKKIGRAALIILLIIVLLIGAVAAFVWSKLGKISYDDGSYKETIAPTVAVDMQTEPTDILIEATTAVTEAPTEPEAIVNMDDLTMETAPNYSSGELFKDKDVMNILLIGSDERTEGFTDNSRSDLNLLVSINKAKKTVKLVSFSRGIAIKMLDGPYKGSYEWLTNAQRWAGPEAVMEAMEDAFKIELNRYVRVNFNSVVEIVDAMGGIDIEMSEAEVKFFNNKWDTNYVAGMNKLYGRSALLFARLRGVDDDWHRMERQRKCILAVVNKLKGSSFSELNDLCDLALSMIRTNLTKMEIAELILYSPKFLESEFDQMTIPLENSYSGMKVFSGAGGWALDYDKNNKALHEFLFGSYNAD